MVDALNLLVAHLGVSPEHVYADAFYPSGIRVSSIPPSESSKETNNDNNSLSIPR